LTTRKLVASASYFFSFSIVRGVFAAALPVLVSAYLFFFLLPDLLTELSYQDSLQATLFISIVGLINNNTFGINQYLIFGLSRKRLPARYILYCCIGLLFATLLLIKTTSPLLDGGLSVFLWALFFIVSLSNIQRAIFESQSRFFLSLLCKLFFNGVLCIVITLSAENGWSLGAICVFYAILFCIFSILAFGFLQNVSIVSSSPVSFRKYLGFFMVFLLIVSFFYSDRFFMLVLEQESFSDHVVRFEQLIKLALPVNIGIMIIFPYLSAEKSLLNALLKREVVAFFCFVVVYIFVSPYLYSILIYLSGVEYGVGQATHLEVFVSTACIAIFLIVLQLTGLYSDRNTLFLLIILAPSLLVSCGAVFFPLSLTTILVFKATILLLSSVVFVITCENLQSKRNI
jgi:hypothetical protein